MSIVGPKELIVVLIVALLVFGPKRLPEVGRSLGRGLREFKEGITGRDDSRELGGRETSSSHPARALPLAAAAGQPNLTSENSDT